MHLPGGPQRATPLSQDLIQAVAMLPILIAFHSLCCSCTREMITAMVELKIRQNRCKSARRLLCPLTLLP